MPSPSWYGLDGPSGLSLASCDSVLLGGALLRVLQILRHGCPDALPRGRFAEGQSLPSSLEGSCWQATSLPAGCLLPEPPLARVFLRWVKSVPFPAPFPSSDLGCRTPQLAAGRTSCRDQPQECSACCLCPPRVDALNFLLRCLHSASGWTSHDKAGTRTQPRLFPAPIPLHSCRRF